MAVCSLGDMKWRIDPNAIHWDYQIDVARIETLGGQVVQVLGATLGDVTVSGSFGQDRGATARESWLLATQFQRTIQKMMDAQVQPQSAIQIGQKTVGIAFKGVRPVAKKGLSITNTVHQPVPFSYQDGAHNWSFKVLIKSIEDADGSQISHTTGKFAYDYRLTLFIVESETDVLTTIAKDDFIANLSDGLGWKQSAYNGAQLSGTQLQAFIAANPNGTTAYAAGLLGIEGTK